VVFAITNDLKAPRKDYTRLYEAIKSFGVWGHFLDSFWLIDTNLTVTK